MADLNDSDTRCCPHCGASVVPYYAGLAEFDDPDTTHVRHAAVTEPGKRSDRYTLPERDLEALDVICGLGHGIGFAVGNVIKLLIRWSTAEDDEKNGADLHKAIDYLNMLKHMANGRDWDGGRLE